jgi:hypothetical protein
MILHLLNENNHVRVCVRSVVIAGAYEDPSEAGGRSNTKLPKIVVQISVRKTAPAPGRSHKISGNMSAIPGLITPHYSNSP